MASATRPATVQPPVGAAAELAGAAINLQSLRDDASETLLSYLHSIKGSKCLVLDPTLGGPLSLILVDGSRAMKGAGVRTLIELNWADLDLCASPNRGSSHGDSGQVEQVEHVVYLVRPQVKLMKQVASQIRAHQFRAAGATVTQQRRRQTQMQQGQSDRGGDDGDADEAGSNAVTFHLFFTPRRSLMCEQILKDEGVSGSLKGRITEFQLGFVPFDNDVLSMELDSAFRQVTLDGDRSPLLYAARALLDLQAVFGPIPNIQSKGHMSKLVIDLMLRMRSEAATRAQDISGSTTSTLDPTSSDSWQNGGGEGGVDAIDPILDSSSGLKFISINGSASNHATQVSEIDTLLLLDRSLDFVTPLCTPLTYEACIDEVYGIKNTFVHLDPGILDPDTTIDTTDTTSYGGSSSNIDHRGKKNTLALNSNDTLFAEARDLNITVLMRFLNERARALKEEREQLDGSREVAVVHSYVKRLPQLQRAIKSLSNHINLAQRISVVTMDKAFRSRWHAERAIVEGESQWTYIDTCIARQEPLVRVLRLMCLHSLASGGVKGTRLDALRRDVLQMYGFDVLFTLDNLEKAALLKRREGSNPWPNIRKNFRLIVEQQADAAEPSDISYVTSGYAPLSVRLVQLALEPGGWKSKLDALKLLPGATICDVRQPGVNVDDSRDNPNSNSNSRIHALDRGAPNGPLSSEDTTTENGNGPVPGGSVLLPSFSSPVLWSGASNAGPVGEGAGVGGRKVMVVFFVGGVTHLEIAALRFLSRQESCAYSIIIATTKIMNGNSMLKSLMHHVEAKVRR